MVVTLWPAKLKILKIWPFSGSFLISAGVHEKLSGPMSILLEILNKCWPLEKQIHLLPSAGDGAVTPGFLLQSHGSPIQKVPDRSSSGTAG